MPTLEQVRKVLEGVKPRPRVVSGTIASLWSVIEEFEQKGVRRRDMYEALIKKGLLPKRVKLSTFTSALTQRKRREERAANGQKP